MKKAHSILEYDTVALDDEAGALVIIDQTKLPGEISVLRLREQGEIWNAIYLLQVRGAPAIGVAAAIGVYLAVRRCGEMDFDAFLSAFQKAKDYLESARPTAVNLSWALRRMERCLLDNRTLPVPRLIERLRAEALEIREEDIRVCRAIGENGLGLVNPGNGLLTHCNAGQLATVQYGTATAPMYLGHSRGYGFRIFADETRPLLQGARLTAYELHAAGMDVTLICDNMAATVMRRGLVDAVFVGCDRVAANGDTANKIGTYPLAIAAKRHGVPVYVCAPTSTIDLACATGADIHIEERPEEEVTSMWYARPMAPQGIKVYNPAFDVTDADLVAAFVTERGVVYPPYRAGLAALFQ